MAKIGDVFRDSPDDWDPEPARFYQVVELSGEWVKLRLMKDHQTVGPVLRRKLVLKKSGEYVRLPGRTTVG